ncbi:MAG TPA: OsmC family protein [Myxococcales bacterium LLY-WYZ-16_1]|jgi:peroxiredoxin-like protein|nr:OsmC family protein [Myxococcales bacterium LLY-WYZ-16_1]
MAEFPHHYTVRAQSRPEGDVAISSPSLPELATAPPAEFGGPGDRWSPETLLVAAVADCFVLSFRAVARASKVEWTTLECEAVGTLDRADRVTRFTEFMVKAKLRVPEGVAEDRARRVLEKAEASCLITNSMKAETHLEATVEVG